MAAWAAGAGILAVVRHTIGGAAGAVAMGLVVWTAGRVWRAQRTLTVELTETTARLAAERDQRAKLRSPPNAPASHVNYTARSPTASSPWSYKPKRRETC